MCGSKAWAARSWPRCRNGGLERSGSYSLGGPFPKPLAIGAKKATRDPLIPIRSLVTLNLPSKISN
jgi:hypothetical protein